MATKQDSNATGLRIAEEETIGVLPVSPVWIQREPNSYDGDFGAQITTVARMPINQSRQRRKGTITGLDSAAGWSEDLTATNMTSLMQGFFFADARQRPSTKPFNGTQVAITGVTAADDEYAAASGLGVFALNQLVLASGFGQSANNGLATVLAADAVSVGVNKALANEASPPAAARLDCVGLQFASADASISLNGSLVRLESAALDMTTLGLIPAQWVYLGGDAGTTTFANNTGWARIGAITADYLEFDKVSWTPQVEAGTGKTIHLYTGTVVKNESDPALIKRRTYQLERTLGRDAVGVQSQYIPGAVPNQLTINIPQEDKVTFDLTFVALDDEKRTGTQGLKTGTRPALLPEDCFNTSLNAKRLKLALVTPDAAVVPLFGFCTSATITVNNNTSPNKAIGVLGAFEMSVGNFDVGGNLEAYFATVDSVAAIRDNEDVTFDLMLAADNQAIIFDIGLLSLGDGRLNVAMNEPIMLPLETNAAENKFNNTFLYQQFPYVPNKAL